ncbi:MAG: hypothetical protein AAF543_06390 [Pseudomonadota bacterium]
MKQTLSEPSAVKHIAFVAHDARKAEMVDWARANIDLLRRLGLHATRATGAMVTKETGLDITLLRSSPVGGDLQLDAVIASNRATGNHVFQSSLPEQAAPTAEAKNLG